MSEERFDRIDARLDRLETGQTELREEVGRLGRHMRVLHEDLVGRIAAVTDAPLATQPDVNRVDARLDDVIEGRIVPLEGAVRDLGRGRRRRDR